MERSRSTWGQAGSAGSASWARWISGPPLAAHPLVCRFVRSLAARDQQQRAPRAGQAARPCNDQPPARSQHRERPWRPSAPTTSEWEACGGRAWSRRSLFWRSCARPGLAAPCPPWRCGNLPSGHASRPAGGSSTAQQLGGHRTAAAAAGGACAGRRAAHSAPADGMCSDIQALNTCGTLCSRCSSAALAAMPPPPGSPHLTAAPPHLLPSLCAQL